MDLVQGNFRQRQAETAPHLRHQFLHFALDSTEKTYSGLTDGCAASGRAGCKLVEITGDGASGDDVKDLINYAHDVTKFFSRRAMQLTPFRFRLLSSSIAPNTKSLLPPDS